jgi:NAD(P)-dependent dehydrogenase (short-subunit alcohol dehydrogenase family)
VPGRATYDFEGSVVAITGGARGQGLAHALRFASAGAQVTVMDRGDGEMPGVSYPLSSRETLADAEAKLAEAGTGSRVRTVDVTDADAVAEAFAELRRDAGRLDILVNNAGVNVVMDLEADPGASWEAMIGVNLMGTLACCREAVPLMRDSGGGRIVNISSLAALVGVRRQVAYAASKAGVLGLTRALAVEAGPYNITVNAICASLVASPQTTFLTRQNPVSLTAGTAGLPYVLPGMNSLKPADVTAAVLWLASEDARFVTGSTLVIDGGRSIK